MDFNRDLLEDNRKGSLTLRSNHMNYSRAILNSKWHQAREAEPKDYDMNKDPIRSLAYSTYKRLGNLTDGSFPDTTYQAHTCQIRLKPLYEARDCHKKMVQLETVSSANAGIDRNTEDSKKTYGATLPYLMPNHNKFYLDTTYNSDYVPPFPFIWKADSKGFKELPEEFEDKSAAFKKMKSQFTDTADYRRNGWNTWQDETGIYANSHFKAQVFSKSETIPERLV